MTTSNSPDTGYHHRAYAESFAGFGRPRLLPMSGGWILERDIAGGEGAADAMGLYPLFACRDWQALHRDLEAVGEDELVSLVLVADPFGGWEETDLAHCFPDRLLRFKDHFVADLRDYPGCDRHHRRSVRQAAKLVDIDIAEPASVADEWIALYGHLIRRHGIGGLSAFSPTALRAQLQVPGLTVFRARIGGETAGMVLFYEAGDAVYYHLGAYSEAGYASRASYGVFAAAIEHFAARGHAWLDLGAGAGVSVAADDGLTRFKRGWATGVRPAYLCGRIFNRRRYVDLARATGNEAAAYFPAYRKGEFG
jgi:hypothetical protein